MFYPILFFSFSHCNQCGSSCFYTSCGFSPLHLLQKSSKTERLRCNLTFRVLWNGAFTLIRHKTASLWGNHFRGSHTAFWWTLCRCHYPHAMSCILTFIRILCLSRSNATLLINWALRGAKYRNPYVEKYEVQTLQQSLR